MNARALVFGLHVVQLLLALLSLLRALLGLLSPSLSALGALLGGLRTLLSGLSVAGALGTVEFSQGVLVPAIPVTAVAEQVVDAAEGGVGFAWLVRDHGDVIEFAGSGDFRLFIRVRQSGKFKRKGFRLFEAPECPFALGDVVNRKAFASRLRFKDFAELGTQGLEFLGIFMLEDDVPRNGESVLEGVHGGGFLAVHGTGAGRTRVWGLVVSSRFRRTGMHSGSLPRMDLHEYTDG